jgi:hypothetical protein
MSKKFTYYLLLLTYYLLLLTSYLLLLTHGVPHLLQKCCNDAASRQQSLLFPIFQVN